MIVLLGCACVAYTAWEVSRLMHTRGTIVIDLVESTSGVYVPRR